MFKVATLLLSTTLLMALLALAPAPRADAFSGSPCPQFAIQDVFDDPSGNWDGDQVNNADELYNGLNPCVVDTTNYCAGGGNPLCIYPTYTFTGYATACQASINAFPNGDYDGDGISNADEIRNYANPCAHPCPFPTNADLALNPNGSWDNDGISNAVEVWRGTNPCDGYAYDPCPHYSQYHIDAMPGLDWDGDGVTNRDEVRYGTNPCVYSSARYVQVVPHYQTVQRLPHVTTPPPRPVYVAPKVIPIHVCPAGYPYFHPGTGLCYANPVKQFWW